MKAYNRITALGIYAVLAGVLAYSPLQIADIKEILEVASYPLLAYVAVKGSGNPKN